ncbi:MAG TPA: EAL domain-containing protein [Polyangiales bacterium]
MSLPGTEVVTIESLRAALEAGELIFHYQPKVSMVLGTVCGAEALIRWCRPDGTMIGPAAFIPLAESTGFITEITSYMLDKLVADLVIARAADPTLTVSFNASARDFEDDRLVQAIVRLLELGIVPADALEVELTESAVLQAGPALSERLGVLRSRGVRLAMDDFGTGYSSIDTLSKLPFTALKIDQGFVLRMETSSKDASIVEASILMGHRIGLEVVAEGIETESVFMQLQAAGCSIGQGYWMARPQPLDRLIALLRGGQRWPAGAIGLLHMATLDHLEWRKALIDALLSDDRQLHTDGLTRFELDPTECRLGRWYNGPGRGLSDLSAFARLGEAHVALHDCAGQITAASKAGGRMAALLPSLRKLTEHSTHIVALLQELEHDVLTRLTVGERTRTQRVLSKRPPPAE